MESAHISCERLTDLAENRLTPDERQASLAHLHNCAHCAERWTRLDQVISLMRTDRAEDAPRDVVANAMRLFGTHKKAAPPLRRILAALSFDSLSLSPALGVRAGKAWERQLLYSAGENDLDLRVTPSNEAWIVSGQMLGPCTGGRVRLECVHGGATATTEMNELCEFALPPVPTGRYTLRLSLADAEIEVPELELRA